MIPAFDQSNEPEKQRKDPKMEDYIISVTMAMTPREAEIFKKMYPKAKVVKA